MKDKYYKRIDRINTHNWMLLKITNNSTYYIDYTDYINQNKVWKKNNSSIYYYNNMEECKGWVEITEEEMFLEML